MPESQDAPRQPMRLNSPSNRAKQFDARGLLLARLAEQLGGHILAEALLEDS